MGRASRARAAVRTQREENDGLLIRAPRRADEDAVAELLGRVEFTRPETGAELAHDMTHGYQLDPACGVRAAWVAERRRGEIAAVLAAAPPLGWIGSLQLLSPEHRSWVASQVVELEALSVAPKAGGRRLGHRMTAMAAAHYSGLGYRLMLGTFTTQSPFLTPYYQQAGFTVLGPGEPIVMRDVLGAALHRPAEPNVVQMWRPLHPDVTVVDTRMPDGSPAQLLTEVLVPPTDALKVTRHDDGSLMLKGGGMNQTTLGARDAELLERMYQTPVTEEEVRAGLSSRSRHLRRTIPFPASLREIEAIGRVWR